MPADVLLELKKTLTYLFLPAPCLACGRIDRDLERPLALCLRCRGRLVRVRHPCCAGCARPLVVRPASSVPTGYRCGRCRLRRSAVERVTAVWVYQEPLDQVILALKFRRLRFLGAQLGRALADRLGRRPPWLEAPPQGPAAAPEEAMEAGPELVVPVPLHWRRRLDRGYNQADEIAHTVADALGLPRVRALRRRRPTRPQMDLPREKRAANLRAAFRCRAPRRVAGRTILLVDDVLTTGSTLDEAARALRAAGSGPIFAAVVARTPEPGEVRMRLTQDRERSTAGARWFVR